MKNDDELPETLIVEPEACLDCGALDWAVANVTPEGKYNKCDQCHYWDAQEQKLKRILHA